MLRTGRLEAFSDGVFAIAITLLVLELSVPEDAGSDLLGAFLDQWPSYLAYVVSFVSIGATWVAHAAITHHLQAMDSVLIRLNLILLLLVSFLPFPTGLTARFVAEDDAARVATVSFGLNLLLVAVAVSALWRYAVRRGLVDTSTDAREHDVHALTQRLTPGIAGYVLLIALGLVAPQVAVLGYLVLAIALLVPVGRRRELRPDPPSST